MQIKNQDINEVLVCTLFKSNYYQSRSSYHKKFNIKLLSQVEPWLKVFFEGNLKVTSVQDQLWHRQDNNTIMEEGGSFEGSGIIN